jgi:hypothetical protein
MGLVRNYLNQYEARHKSVTLDQLFAEFIESKSHPVPRYLRQIRACQARFAHLGQTRASDLNPLVRTYHRNRIACQSSLRLVLARIQAGHKLPIQIGIDESCENRRYG